MLKRHCRLYNWNQTSFKTPFAGCRWREERGKEGDKEVREEDGEEGRPGEERRRKRRGREKRWGRKWG